MPKTKNYQLFEMPGGNLKTNKPDGCTPTGSVVLKRKNPDISLSITRLKCDPPGKNNISNPKKSLSHKK